MEIALLRMKLPDEADIRRRDECWQFDEARFAAEEAKS
jgi:hypothetical protein